MREILFRGKRLVIGDWVIGNLFVPTISEGHTEICVGTETTRLAYDVDPKTVGQWTGLTNSNGTKIFEGDICDFSVFDYNDCDTQYRGVVVYDGSRFMLWKKPDSEYYGNDGGFDLDWVLAQDDEFKVVGNLWDDPNLLEEAHDEE